MSLAILFHFLCAQHDSDINISIIRSLRLFCWITTLVVLFLVRCVLEFRCGWVGVVPQNMVYPALLLLMHTTLLPVVEWTDPPANLNGLVRFSERPNLVSARVPSRFKRALPDAFAVHQKELKTAHTASGIGLTYTWLCLCSFELLMMGRKTVWNR